MAENKPEKEFNSPMDDQGITTQNVLEIGENLIQRVWGELQEKKEIPLADLEKLANIADIAYNMSVGAIRVGSMLTNDYMGDDDDFDDDLDDDPDEEDGYKY